MSSSDTVILITAPGDVVVRQEKGLQLHAQVSFDKPRQFSGNFQNVRMYKDEDYQKKREFLGIDENVAKKPDGAAVTGNSGVPAVSNASAVTGNSNASAVTGGSNASAVSGGETGAQTDKPFTFTNYMKDSSPYLRFSDTLKGAKGFLDTITDQKKNSLSTGAKLAYKIGLLIFFTVNLLYPIIVFAVDPKHVPYNVICGVISLIGFVYECIEVTLDIHKICKNRQGADIQQTESKEDGSYKGKVLKIFKEFVIDSLGEILIYPSIICSLYGFINERGWEFNTTLSIFDFLLLLYTFVMDAIYAKLYHIWLVRKLVKASYKAYDEHENITDLKCWNRCCEPLAMSTFNSCILAVLHWLMLAIIGVRIYADNFQGEDEQNVEGSFRVSGLTGFMIGCGAYLPVACMAVYVIVNKYWFLQIYWLVYDKRTTYIDNRKKYNYIKQIPGSVKLLGFLKDPVAYIAVIGLVAPFIAFLVGAYLQDINDAPDGANVAAGILGTLFLFCFMFCNVQACLIAAIMGIIAAIALMLFMMFICFLATAGSSSTSTNSRYRR